MDLFNGRSKEKEKQFLDRIRQIDDDDLKSVTGGMVTEYGSICEADGYRCPQCGGRTFVVKENSWGIRLICSRCGYEDSHTGFRE